MGRWIGAIIGAVVGNIPGALLGYFVGYLFERRQQLQGFDFQRGNSEQAQETFFVTTFTLLGHVAKADGRVSEAEIRQAEQLMDKLQLTADHRRRAIDIFKQGSNGDFDLAALIQKFNQECGRHQNLRQMLLVYLVNLALADDSLDSSEENALREIATLLGIPAFAFDQMIRMIRAQNQFGGSQYQRGHYGGQASSSNEIDLAYQALGVEESISDKDLKKAYRKLMSQYHPDKLMGQGLPEDMIQEATERSKEIQVAYDLVRKARR